MSMPARLGQVLCIAIGVSLVVGGAHADPLIGLLIREDGSVAIDGQPYADLNAVELKLIEIASHEQQIKLRVEKKATYEKVAAIIYLLQITGSDIGMRGYLTAPASAN